MKTEVDLIQLAQAVSAAILQFAQLPTVADKTEAAPEVIEQVKKKRGRPKKIQVEEISDPEPEPVRRNSSFTAPTKLEAHEAAKKREGGGTYMKKVPFKKRPRVNQWVDNLSIAQGDLFNKEGKKLVYPPHTEPRPPQEEYEYKCDLCNRKFKAFPSYVAGSVDGESQPQIRCFDCNSRR